MSGRGGGAARQDATARLLSEARARLAGGDHAGARSALRRLPARMRGESPALRLLGLIDFAAGDHRAAARRFAKVAATPDATATDHMNLGLALARLGERERARAAYEQALALEPGLAEARFNLANLYRQAGELAAAEAGYRDALVRTPGDARCHFNLGLTLAAAHRHSEAIECFSRARGLAPDLVQAENEIGLSLAALGDHGGAEARYRRVLATMPGNPLALTNLAHSLIERRRFDDAIGCLQAACRDPGAGLEPQFILGETLLRVGRTEAGEAALRTVLGRAPAHPRALAALAMILQWECRWDELDAVRCVLHPLAFEEIEAGRRSPIAPHTALSQGFSPAQERQIAESWSRDQARAVASVRDEAGFEHPPRVRDRIRVAYFSNDFNSQATAHLIAGLFEHHDRSRFEVFAYSFGPDDGSTWRRRIEAASEHFIDVTKDDFRATASRMHADGIDILLDFKGFTAEARPQVYALKPAPIQVNYLGFPGTIGAPWMDYLVADEIVIPPEERQHYSEAVVYLPECYQANDDRQAIADWPARREDVGLPEDGIVFSCFNETYKIDRTIFAVWMRILARVPNSLLWLRDHSPRLRETLRSAASAHGIDPTRLHFAGVLPKEQHLARCRLADLFLDSHMLTAHTTATDTLWAGVPMITCPRDTFATRVGKSLLENLGMPELAVGDLAAYEELAVSLAKDPAALAALRDRLAANIRTTPLFDTRRLTRHLEAAFAQMYARYLAGAEPEPFRVAALPRGV